MAELTTIEMMQIQGGALGAPSVSEIVVTKASDDVSRGNTYTGTTSIAQGVLF